MKIFKKIGFETVKLYSIFRQIKYYLSNVYALLAPNHQLGLAVLYFLWSTSWLWKSSPSNRPVCGQLIHQLALAVYVCRFNPAQWIGNMKRFFGADTFLSLWVYLDDLNTEENVIYVRRIVFFPNFLMLISIADWDAKKFVLIFLKSPF